MTQTDSSQQSPDAELKGISGWLMLPLLQLIGGGIYYLWSCVNLYPQLVERQPQFPAGALAVSLGIIALPWFSFVVFCLVRFLQERRSVPLLMTILYGLHAGLVLANWVGYANGYSWAATQAVRLYPFGFMLQIGVALAMIAYFHTSVRVKNTFVVVAPSRLPRSPRPERAGIGGALWLLIGYLALITALAGIAMATGNLPGKTQFAIQHHHWAAIAMNAAKILLAIFSCACLVLIARRERLARWLTLAAFALWSLIAGLSPIVQPGSWRGMIVFAAINAACAIYFLVSKRVKNTFDR